MSTIGVLPQQHIIDFLSDEGLECPNTFSDSRLSSRMLNIGFEIAEESGFKDWVTATNHRYPSRRVVPFGQRIGDDDTIALDFSPNRLGQVVQFHGWTDAGFEYPEYFATLTDWLEYSR